MKKNIRIYLEDILECLQKIVDYTSVISEQEFYKSTQIQDAVLRRLEIIGETVKNIPHSFRDKYSDVPWKSIAGMRDVLIHEYSGVNLKRVWKVAKVDVIELKEKMKIILNEFKDDQESLF